MRLYCVLSWISTTKMRKGQSRIENTERKQNYYTKLETAKAVYDTRVREIDVDLSCSYRGQTRQGRAKLFIPHVSSDGMLMDWPKEKYIREYNKSDQGG